LWKSTAGSSFTKSGVKTERFQYRQVGFYNVERSAGLWNFLEDGTTTLRYAGINFSDDFLFSLNFSEVERLDKGRFGGQNCCVENAASSWDELTSSSVNSVSMEGSIMKVEADTTERLTTENSFTCNGFEGGAHVILDFIEVLYSMRNIDNDVGSREEPNLGGVGLVPSVIVGKLFSSDFGVFFFELFVLESLAEFLIERSGSEVETVVLVGGFSETNNRGSCSDRFTKFYDRRRDRERDVFSSHISEFSKSDFNVEFSGSGNDELVVGGNDLQARIGFFKTFKSVSEFFELGSVLWGDCTTHDRGDGEFHRGDRVSELGG
jgi:hypothetical protein